MGSVDTGLVLKALEPIWATKPETAGRVRGRVEAVLDWAKARGYRDGENPARWRGHLDKLLPNRRKVRSVRNHPAMPYSDLPVFMAELRSRQSVSARALEFAILTAARTGEVIGAKLSEIDLDNAVWTVPADRMKASKEHRVPLSPRAVEIVRELPRDGDYVFPGGRAGKPLSNMALLELMRGMRPEYVPHGFRSTFRDWAVRSGRAIRARLSSRRSRTRSRARSRPPTGGATCLRSGGNSWRIGPTTAMPPLRVPGALRGIGRQSDGARVGRGCEAGRRPS